MSASSLPKKPKSKILEKGYINVYSSLTSAEKRQLFYNRQYKKINPIWDNTLILLCKRFKWALKQLDLYDQEKAVVLDAGCGHGNYVIDEFRAKISWAIGIDLNKRFTQKNICLDEIKHANLESIPFQDNTFDIVLSLWVIEHLEKPEVVFKEIHRVLKPGGFFIFSTPNKFCFLVIANRAIKSIKKINLALNKKLYGRDEVDIFPTFYKANDGKTLLRMLNSLGFREINLKLNYDPGFTSFNTLTFKLSVLADTLFEKFAPQWYKQHIVGSTRKASL